MRTNLAKTFQKEKNQDNQNNAGVSYKILVRTPSFNQLFESGKAQYWITVLKKISNSA